MKPIRFRFIASVLPFTASVILNLAPTTATAELVLYYDFEQTTPSETIENRGAADDGTLLLDLSDVPGDVAGDHFLRGDEGAPGGFTPDTSLELFGTRDNRIATGLILSDLGMIPVGADLASYTAAGWVNFGTIENRRFLFGQLEGRALHLGIQGGTPFFGHWSNDTRGTTTINVAEWTHLAYRYQNGQQTIFVNGVEDITQSRGDLTDDIEVQIGVTRSESPLLGLIDDVVIYDEGLADNQIVHLANGGDPLDLPAPVAGPVENVFFTMPYGDGGTWNLYQVVGTSSGSVPLGWWEAHQVAIAADDPSGLTASKGHLVHVESSQENFAVNGITGRVDTWIGLSDFNEDGEANSFTNAEEAASDRDFGWTWVNATSMDMSPVGEPPFVFERFANGQPDDAGDGEDAVRLSADTFWADDPSGIPGALQDPSPPRVYVIEWDTESATPVTVASETVTVVSPTLPEVFPGPDPVVGEWSFRLIEDLGLDEMGEPIQVLNLGQAVSIAQAVVDGNPDGFRVTDGTSATLNHSDPGEPGRLGSFLNENDLMGSSGVNDAVVVATATIQVPVAGGYTFWGRSDDGFALRLPGREFIRAAGVGQVDPFDTSTLIADALTGDTNTRGFVELEAGEQVIEYLFFERGGGLYLELAAVAGDNVAPPGNSIDWRLVGGATGRTVPVPTVTAAGFTVTTIEATGSAITMLDAAEAAFDANVKTEATGITEINFANAGDAGFFASDSPLPNGVTGDGIVARMSATMEVPESGEYQIGFRGDDGAYLQILDDFDDPVLFNRAYVIIDGTSGGGQRLVNDESQAVPVRRIQFDRSTGNSTTVAGFDLEEGIEYTLELLYFQNSGSANFEVFGGQDMVFDLIRASGSGMVTDTVQPLILVPAPLDSFEIQSVDYDRDLLSVTLVFDSIPGETYRIERSTDLTTWVAITPDVLAEAAPATSTTFEDNSVLPSTEDVLFYRVVRVVIP